MQLPLFVSVLIYFNDTLNMCVLTVILAFELFVLGELLAHHPGWIADQQHSHH